LREAIGKHLSDRVEVTGYGAGAHVALWPRARIVESAVIAKAAALGVAVYGISPYFLTTPRRSGLMLGYSRMKETDIREGVRRLSEVL
jgi:GntR family transcriptional regulator/MocR family aminotransferase